MSEAGYSGTPLHRKLGIKAGERVEVVDGPAGWAIAGLPDGVEVSASRGTSPVDTILAFFRDRASLERDVPRLARGIVADGKLWLAWPRRAAGHTSDITDNRIREVVLPLGLVDVKVAALDNDWSGLKVVWRKELRQKLR